ncbi:MAG TPA: hypothetical protein VFL47_04225 [Flavisolibacter sp.]|nr:hypothetical protein [Flavisolibacter sp.]
MKNNIFFAVALLIGTAVNAQTTTPTTQPVADTTVTTVIADTSVNVGAAYVTHPERLQGLTTETLTTAHIFPVLGSYSGNGTSTEAVTITLDETNKGIVWIDGLEQGRFKALMKKAPATYKIPAQKTESGKSVAEGTLYFNPETNELKIVLGQPFNDQDPTAFSTVSSKKTKVWQYTGVKAGEAATPVTQ